MNTKFPTYEEFEQLLIEKHRLEQALKRRAMIYQAEAKENAARAFGKPLDYYYNYSYAEWSKVSEEYVKKEQKVIEECIKMGIPGNMPFSEFPYFREQMGLN